ncbi:fungal peroxidase [Mycena metata]|uniref:Fungal peroxidase n=1 Tax=Mycena metata TaxID=1033252 RepID=A0AAD7HLM5_9AGAR|nr:fungal peroxidase [Mycena metata]
MQIRNPPSVFTMRLNTIPTLLSLTFCAGIVSATRLNAARSLEPRRKTSLLINPAAQPELPTLKAAKAAANAVSLNLTDIQGDILIGMKKNKELFFFFGIENATEFKAKLKSDILPLVTTTTQLLDNTTQPTTALNIAFSQTGLFALNITDNLNDAPFAGGQLADIGNLGDPGTTNWVPQFVGTDIHGVILLASDTVDNINTELASIQSKLGDCITEIYSLQGAARPGNEQGHEHFGFQDGISNPAVSGYDSNPVAGQAVVPTGEILVGEEGDSFLSSRPAWAKDGSFLVFRQLKQIVPEFNKFLLDNPIHIPALTPEQGSELLGARMIGRWKSGAPVFLAPLVDDPILGGDRTRNNNFTYLLPGQTAVNATDQSRCPFSAHVRKTRPRADIGLETNNHHHIVRGGIPYGPEVTAAEAASNTTTIERGLAFVCYQSSTAAGFRFLQQAWADNTSFVHGGVGFDPIIGANQGAQRVVNGLDPTDPSRNITLITDFVVSRGGEYFFSPSLSAIANTLSV